MHLAYINWESYSGKLASRIIAYSCLGFFWKQLYNFGTTRKSFVKVKVLRIIRKFQGYTFKMKLFLDLITKITSQNIPMKVYWLSWLMPLVKYLNDERWNVTEFQLKSTKTPLQPLTKRYLIINSNQFFYPFFYAENRTYGSNPQTHNFCLFYFRKEGYVIWCHKWTLH